MAVHDSEAPGATLELIESCTGDIQDAEDSNRVRTILSGFSENLRNSEGIDGWGHVREGLYGVAVRKSLELADPDLTREMISLMGPSDSRVGVPFREHLVEALQGGETPDLSLLDLLPPTEAGEQARANAIQELRLRVELDRVNA